MLRRNVKWFGLGLGVGLVLAGMVSVVQARRTPEAAIIRQARELGMVFREEIVSYTKGPIENGERLIVAVIEGQTSAMIADALVVAGIIPDREQLMVWLPDPELLVRPGLYEFRAGEDLSRIAQKISSGEVLAGLE